MKARKDWSKENTEKLVLINKIDETVKIGKMAKYVAGLNIYGTMPTRRVNATRGHDKRTLWWKFIHWLRTDRIVVKIPYVKFGKD